MIGAAAEIAQPRHIEVDRPLADVDGAAQLVRVVVEIEPAAFEKADAERSADQFAGQGDAGRAGANNADIGFNKLALRYDTRVDEHASAPGRKNPPERRTIISA